MKRINEYDHLRVMAMIMVMITHAVQIDLGLELYGDHLLMRGMRGMAAFCMVCNLIYIMLSGALILPWKEEKLSRFYIHHMTKIAVPMILYYLFYLWQNRLLFPVHKETLKMIFFNLYEGNTIEAPQYWVMYVMLAFYIVAPFLRYMVKELPYRYLTVMVGICLVAMTGTMYFEFQPPFEIGLSEWPMAAVMGYWVTRKETRKYDKVLWTGGGLAFLHLLRIVLKRKKYMQFFLNCSPTLVLFSLAIFALVLHYPKVFSKTNKITKLLSKYSFSIILIHWWTLNWITIGKLSIHTTTANGLGIILSPAVTLVVSFVAVLLIDHVIVNPVTNLVEKGLMKMQNICNL